MTESTSLTSQLNMLQNYSLFVVSSNDNIYQIARLDTASFQFHEQLVCFTFKINLGMLLFDVKFSIVTVENYTENMFVCANFRYLGTGKQFGKLTGKIGSFAVVKWTSIFIEMVQIGDLSCSELSYI
ncbi:hypothetical protein SS50377_22423 [Spironucleus salmonicida]|nr:hypothetical protein SS50377_22423 [Spironucleus salmonicida]